MLYSCALHLRHGTQHVTVNGTSLQLHRACYLALHCKYGTTHSMLLLREPACICIMHALWLCTASTTCHPACCCNGYQRAAAACVLYSCALHVRHGTHHVTVKGTSLQLHHACALAVHCTHGMAHSMMMLRGPNCSCTMHAL